jgi:hypothetical protein
MPQWPFLRRDWIRPRTDVMPAKPAPASEPGAGIHDFLCRDDGGDVDAWVFARAGGDAAALGRRGEILAAGEAAGQCVWGSEFDVHVRAAGGVCAGGGVGGGGRRDAY